MRLLSRPVRLLGAGGLLAATIALGTITVAGCSRTVAAPEVQARYQTLPPKEVPEHLRGTIFELVDTSGTSPRISTGYGLVVNLENTGRDDGIPTPVREAIQRSATIRGVDEARTVGALGQLSPNSLLADPRTAVVRVEGVIPPGARPGQRMDVVVSALESNTTPSLARGFLWQTELYKGIVNEQNPGEVVNRNAVARGPLMVNPVYALAGPEEIKDDPAAVSSLRRAIIPDGGIVQEGRSFVLKLRQPERRMARLIEKRLNYHFGQNVAAAQDEAIIELRMPEHGPYKATGPESWQRFLNVALHVYLRGAEPGYGTRQAEQLAQMAMDAGLSDEELVQISWAWEGLGQIALPTLVSLLDDPNPAVAFYAARAAAHLRESAATNALLRAAGETWNPYNVKAARELGRLEPTEGLIRDVRRLLDEDRAGNRQVRIEAYESLVRLGDRSIHRQAVDDKFYLHVTPGQGTPIIYARRTGTPTIAIIGGLRNLDDMPRLRPSTLLSVFGDRLTISRPGDGDVRLFQNLFLRDGLLPDDGDTVLDARPSDFIDMRSLPDLREVIGRLGGEGIPGERRLRVSYGDVVAVLKELGDEGLIVAGPEGEQVVAVKLQDVAIDQVDSAPIVPGLESQRLGSVSAGN